MYGSRISVVVIVYDYEMLASSVAPDASSKTMQLFCRKGAHVVTEYVSSGTETMFQSSA